MEQKLSATVELASEMMEIAGVPPMMVLAYKSKAVTLAGEIRPLVLDFAVYDKAVIEKLNKIGKLVYLVMPVMMVNNSPTQSVCYYYVPHVEYSNDQNSKEKYFKVGSSINKLLDTARKGYREVYIVNTKSGKGEYIIGTLKIKADEHTYLVD